ncbi:MAG: hypothetical protein AAF700_07550 [Pseudomonadota bacterium]
MLIELIGVPGSGKSTVLRALLPALRAQRVQAHRADRLIALESTDPNAPRYLKRGPDRLALYRSLQFRRSHPALLMHIEQDLAPGPADAFLFSWTTNLFQAAREHGPKDGFTFLDEGLVHRGASFHQTAEPQLFEHYLSLIPLPDVVVNLCPPPRLAYQRAVARRAHKTLPRAKVEAKFGDKLAFRERHRFIERGLDHLRGRGAVIWDIDTSEPLSSCTDAIVQRLLTMRERALASATAAE